MQGNLQGLHLHLEEQAFLFEREARKRPLQKVLCADAWYEGGVGSAHGGDQLERQDRATPGQLQWQPILH